ncbi:MAG: hypothetical protein ACR2LF_02405 [Jatrophihabitantaceae bacterium]
MAVPAFAPLLLTNYEQARDATDTELMPLAEMERNHGGSVDGPDVVRRSPAADSRRAVAQEAARSTSASNRFKPVDEPPDPSAEIQQVRFQDARLRKMPLQCWRPDLLESVSEYKPIWTASDSGGSQLIVAGTAAEVVRRPVLKPETLMK